VVVNVQYVGVSKFTCKKRLGSYSTFHPVV
jgi:hypothetical protein